MPECTLFLKICSNDWLYTAWDFYTAQCGDYISAQHYITSFKYLLVQEESIKIVFPPLVMTVGDYGKSGRENGYIEC